MATNDATPQVEGKVMLRVCSIAYAFFLLSQFAQWGSDPSVHKGGLTIAFLLAAVHLFFAFIMPLDEANFTFWTSCTFWVLSIVACTLLAGAFPSAGFVLVGGISLVYFYEYYSAILNRAGCTTLREGFFTGLFRSVVRRAPSGAVSDASGEKLRPITQPRKQGTSFASIYGMDEEKKRIKAAAQEIIHGHTARNQVRNGILLTGEPGNGKTQLAKALAGELNLPFLEITNGLVASQWINETTVNLMRAFAEVKRRAPCVLLIDEIDSFLSARDTGATRNTEDSKIVNTLLTELVNMRACRVIIIAATNHPQKLDSAGVREGRFDFKIEVLPPDRDARRLILKDALSKSLPNVRIEDGAVETVVARWSGFSVVRILAVAKELEAMQRERAMSQLAADDIFKALRLLQGSQGLPVDTAKGIDKMLLADALKDDLTSIVYRMTHIQEIEEAGGSLPTGLVFYGAEPGTGKTECARSLAKDSGWAFLATTSNDLIADHTEIDTIYKKALNIRPCIIFIDEANDVLRDRSMSPNAAITNKLLTVMDGVSNERRDIMFIAATNYVEQIDAAVLRGGRISEKFHFGVPEIADQIAYIADAIKKSRAKFAPDVSAAAVAMMMDKMGVAGTVANMATVLQDAVNSSLGKGASSLGVSLDDIGKSIRRQTVA